MVNQISFWDYSIEGSPWRIAAEREAVVMVMPMGGVTKTLERTIRRFSGLKMIAQRTDLTDQTAMQLDEFLKGKRTDFDINVKLHGTEFERRVWQRLMNVGFGKTTTYSELARECGSPSGARAVGGAVGRNPLLIVVPCHRVLAADGSLGGFSAGLELKKQLLLTEGILL